MIKKNVRRIVIGMVLSGFLCIILMFINHRFFTKNQSDDNEKNNYLGKATLSLDHVSHSSTKEGRLNWTLNANTAAYYHEDAKAIFEMVSVTFFNKKGKPISISANQGILNTTSQDIQLTGNITCSYEDYVLKTEKINYVENNHSIQSNNSVFMTSQWGKIQAKAMLINLQAGDIHLKGNVEALLTQQVKLL
ncbi:MAG: LPS export ABC transporter periplasmic protein LptC [Desulfobacterales bacterium]|nr:LPS export ABC transporter periplasmic protein LptC [Desulfobacterales bacterium]